MSKLHVLAGSGNTYTVVVHQATPAGNNSAGVPWATVIINSGRNTTIMVEGSGAGQIAASEAAEIVAGTTVEGVFAFTDNPSWTGAQRNAELDAQATSMVSQLTSRIANELKWWGVTRA